MIYEESFFQTSTKEMDFPENNSFQKCWWFIGSIALYFKISVSFFYVKNIFTQIIKSINCIWNKYSRISLVWTNCDCFLFGLPKIPTRITSNIFQFLRKQIKLLYLNNCWHWISQSWHIWRKHFFWFRINRKVTVADNEEIDDVDNINALYSDAAKNLQICYEELYLDST